MKELDTVLTTQPLAHGKRTSPPGLGEYDLSPAEAAPVGRRVVFHRDWTPDDPPRRHRDARRGRMPLMLFAGLLLGAAAVAFGLSLSRDYLLGQIAAPLLAIGALHGLWRGGFRKVVMLAATIGAMTLASRYPAFAAPVVERLTGSPSPIGAYVVTGAAVMGFLIVTALFVGTVRRRWIARHAWVSALDRFIGSVLGTAEGALVVLCLCWVATMTSPHTRLMRDHPSTAPGSLQHGMVTALLRLDSEARAEPVRRLVEATNLIEHVPALRNTIDELNATGALNLERLDPEIAAALQRLLRESPAGSVGNLDSLIEKHRRANEARDKAYRQLPHSKTSGK